MADTKPRWQLHSIYPGPDSPEYRAACTELHESIAAASRSIDDRDLRESDPIAWLRTLLDALDRLFALHTTVESYTYCAYSTDTQNAAASAALVALGEFSAPLQRLRVAYRSAVAGLDAAVIERAAADARIGSYAFILREQRFLATRQLGAAEESLAADLNRSGADAWERLHQSLSSTLVANWPDGTSKTIVELRALARHSDRAVRRTAYQLELATWQTNEIAFAAAINGVKGASVTLNAARGWSSTLERSAHQCRLSPATLDALLGSMRAALPVLGEYLQLKARLLGLERLAFYDLFAPVGDAAHEWSYHDAIGFIVTQFGRFSPEMASFAQHAVDSGWIDAAPRPGKVGGAYCTDLPTVGESRILSNFDGTYDELTTLAHELGHAYHSFVMRDLPELQRDYPMTLAETASIFCETIVFSAALDAASPAERLPIVEHALLSATQVIVDILSRFEFESGLMERRAETELTPTELCERMLAAQERTYGSALEPAERHPYMWAVKPHYYRADLAFYNFPYAFGQLFGLGLFAQWQTDPDRFPERYRELLRRTGRASVEDVAAGAGIDVTKRAFWDASIARIAEYVALFRDTIVTKEQEAAPR